MTTPPATAHAPGATAEPSEPVRDRTVIVDVPRDSRLETLLCLWENAKAKLDAAEADYDDLKAGILRELQSLDGAPDIKCYEIPANRMHPGLAYTYSRTPYLPAGKIRDHLPAVYDAFKQYKASWVLRKKGKR